MKRKLVVYLLLLFLITGCAGSGMVDVTYETCPSGLESSDSHGDAPPPVPGLSNSQVTESNASLPLAGAESSPKTEISQEDIPLVLDEEKVEFEYTFFEPSDGLLKSIARMDDNMLKQQMGRLGMFRMGDCLIYADHTAPKADREVQIQYLLLDTGEEGVLLSTSAYLSKVSIADKDTLMINIYDREALCYFYYKFNIITGEMTFVRSISANSAIYYNAVYHNDTFYAISIPGNQKRYDIAGEVYWLYNIYELLPDGKHKIILENVTSHYFYDNEVYYTIWPASRALRVMNLETNDERILFFTGDIFLLALDGQNVAYASPSGITMARLEDGARIGNENVDLSELLDVNLRALSKQNNNNKLSVYKNGVFVFNDESYGEFPLSYLYYINFEDGTINEKISNIFISNYYAVDNNLYLLITQFEEGQWKSWLHKESFTL